MTTTEHDYIADDLRSLAFPVANLKLLPGNPRRGDVDAVARSYERFGQRKPIVARRSDMTVIAGNHQLQAAQRLGWTHVAVVWTDDDDLTAKAYALADNRTADLGSYDEDALGALLAQVAVDPALLSDTGYTLDDLISDAGGGDSTLKSDPDEVPDSAPAKTVTGDVWLLGNHRLMCGDSTVPTDFDRLMAGSVADMVWTDPPYGVKYVGKTSDALTIENDDLDAAGLEEFLAASLGCAAQVTKPGGAWFVAAPAGPLFLSFGNVLTRLGIWRQTLVWVKDAFVLGRSDYHYRHEAIFYGWKPGASHTAPPDRTQDTIWEVERPRRNAEHPTMKPVALITRAIENHSESGDLVLDPFGGSGSTLIASHSLGRSARLMELDPRYCDVICARFQKATGIVPVAESTGREHSFIEE